MNRRSIQNGIVWAATLLFVGYIGYWGIKGNFRDALKACVGYVVFLAAFVLICRYSISKADRKRPAPPVEFRHVCVGVISESLKELLLTARITETRIVGAADHVLYELKRDFPNGEWICQFEIAGKQVLARYILFRSNLSPVLDYGSLQGSGVILRGGSLDVV
jgi:hypothetical protein